MRGLIERDLDDAWFAGDFEAGPRAGQKLFALQTVPAPLPQEEGSPSGRSGRGNGARDNARNYVEDGNFGGKDSETHKAAVGGAAADQQGRIANRLMHTDMVILDELGCLPFGQSGGRGPAVPPDQQTR
jgi:hypothetical protein